MYEEAASGFYRRFCMIWVKVELIPVWQCLQHVVEIRNSPIHMDLACGKGQGSIEAGNRSIPAIREINILY